MDIADLVKRLEKALDRIEEANKYSHGYEQECLDKSCDLIEGAIKDLKILTDDDHG